MICCILLEWKKAISEKPSSKNSAQTINPNTLFADGTNPFHLCKGRANIGDIHSERLYATISNPCKTQESTGDWTSCVFSKPNLNEPVCAIMTEMGTAWAPCTASLLLLRANSVFGYLERVMRGRVWDLKCYRISMEQALLVSLFRFSFVFCRSPSP